LIACRTTYLLKFGEQLVFKKLENNVLERAPVFGFIACFFVFLVHLMMERV